MDLIFEVIDKTGRKIHLSKERWSHIRQEHTQIDNIEEIENTLKKPVKIISHEEGELYDYYNYYKTKNSNSKYLKIVVKYLNGSGFVLTAYFVRNINQ